MRTNSISIFRPYTRYHLLRDILNRKIIQIYSCFDSEEHYLQRYSSYIKNIKFTPEQIFLSTRNGIMIEFEGNICVDILYLKRDIMLRYSNTNGHKILSGGFKNTPFNWSLGHEDLQGLNLRKAIRQKVVAINYFKFKLDRRCLELKLSNEASILLGEVEYGQYSYPSLAYILPNDDIWKNLEKKEIICNKPDFMLPDEYLIYRGNLEGKLFIEPYYGTSKQDFSFNLKTNIYLKELMVKPLDNYIFLTRVFEYIFDKQISIADLRFGLSKAGIIKIIKPVDIYKSRVWEENIYFIHSLMNEISRMIPKEIEEYQAKLS